MITQCVEMKKAIVEEDEFDQGCRQLLNLGHTLGHAIEKNSDFTLSHGQCVAIGMAMIARSAHRLGFCTAETRDTIISTLAQYGLPTETDQHPDAICRTALGDKKRQSDTITLVVPREIGCCELHPIPVSELHQWLPAGGTFQE